MLKTRLLTAAGMAAFAGLLFAIGCTKGTTPIPPPVHDTVTVYSTGTDTTIHMNQGLVLYLPFNGSFADSSGSGNTVTAIGGATLDYDMHGYASSAFNATGAGERLVVSNNGAYKVDTAFTASCDFMMRSNAYFNGGYDFSGLQVFMSIVNVNAGYGATFDFGMTLPNAPQSFAFGVIGAQGNDCSSYNVGNYISDTTQFTPQLGSWYNVVCVYHKSTVSVYLNGKLISTSTNPNVSSALFCSDANFVIGGWWNGGNSGNENLRGKLDDVRFYNRALNPNEIAWLARNFTRNSTSIEPGIKTN